LASTSLGLDGPYVTLGPKEVIAFLSTGASVGGGPKWQQIWKSASNYASASHVGNFGEGRRVITTTSSTTPTEIYKVDVANCGLACGTLLDFDVVAQSQNGANVGAWLGYELGWNTSGTLFLIAAGTRSGTGAGNLPPLGWNLTWDPTGTTPFAKIYVAGDSSSNAVTWTINARHRDPGQ
jgi:hypothetical protein